MKTTCLLIILFIAGIVRGGELHISSKEPVVVVAPDKWTAGKYPPPNPDFPFETYKIEPPANRNAGFLVSIYDKNKPDFTNADLLKKVLRADSRPYVSSAGDLSKVDVKELKIEGGLGFYANFIDPDLVGKPVTPGEFKTATPIIVSLSTNYLMKFTILCDKIDGPDYRDAMAIVKSVKVKKE
jgi:hypothetical protein